MLNDIFDRGRLDNPINRTILSTFMKKKKVKYDVAKNGEEAVEKWRSGNFQLILVSEISMFGAYFDDGDRWIFRCRSWTGLRRRKQ